jgi:hypothetical protein
VVYIFHDQPLLRIKSQEFILGDIEERSIEVGGVFREVVTSSDMKLGAGRQWLIIP